MLLEFREIYIDFYLTILLISWQAQLADLVTKIEQLCEDKGSS